MRWPWNRAPREPHTDPRAVDAAHDAAAKLAEARSRQPRVDRVQRRLAELADRNGFVDAIEATFVRRHS